MATPNWWTDRPTDALVTGGLNGLYNLDHRGHLTNYDRVWASKGLVVMNNLSNPGTQLDISADLVAFRSATGYNVVAEPGPLTLNLNTAGPVANGRDQASAFANNTWVHAYYIATRTNPPTVATIASATAPPDGPVLPAGYSHGAYVGSYLKDSGGNLLYIRQVGDRVLYAWEQTDSRQRILSAGVSSPWATVSAASVVPPTSRCAIISWILSLVHTTAGQSFSVFYNPAAGGVTVGGTVYAAMFTQVANGPVEHRVSQDTWLSATQQLQYRISVVPNVTGGVYLDVLGYYLPV